MNIPTISVVQFMNTKLDQLIADGYPIDHGNLNDIDKSMFVDPTNENKINFMPILSTYNGRTILHNKDWIILDTSGQYHVISDPVYNNSIQSTEKSEN